MQTKPPPASRHRPAMVAKRISRPLASPLPSFLQALIHMKSLLLRTSLMSIGAAALFGCAKSDPPPAPPPPQVGVLEAQPQDVPLTRKLVGRLSAYYSANVTARVSGVLLKRLYTEGSEVKTGQVMFEIDPAWYQTVLNNDLATLAQDQA